MDRTRLSAIAHRDRPVAGPVDDRHVDRLLGVLDPASGAAVLDVGCGEAEWLLRLLERRDDVGAEGVDRSAHALERARARAAARLGPGWADRLRLHEGDYAAFAPRPEGYDAVLCVGSTHVLGGLGPALAAVAGLVRPGGVALVGEGFWARPPAAAALSGLGGASADDLADLAGTLGAAVAAGFTPLHAHVSTEAEWDDYEWAWVGALERHVREHPDDPDAAEIRRAARQHRDGYLGGYRGVLGFVTVVLGAWP